MDSERLFQLLKTVQVRQGVFIDVAYDHFTTPNQVPPFIVYVIDTVSTLKADDKVHYQDNNYIVDLCTNVKNVELETQLEQLFNDNFMPYDKEETYIDSEHMFQIRYFI